MTAVNSSAARAASRLRPGRLAKVRSAAGRWAGLGRSGRRRRHWRALTGRWIRTFLGAWLAVGLAVGLTSCGRRDAPSGQTQPQRPKPRPPGAASKPASGASPTPGVVYLKDVVTNVPWCIQVAKIDRTRPDLELHTMLAWGRIAGLATLSDQVALVPPEWGRPVVALNGDFYVVDPKHPYVGDPRGLQIMDGELVSGPTDQDSFWLDPAGRAQVGHVQARFEVRWPDGTTSPFGLNEERPPAGVVLYTPRMGVSTRTPAAGLEFVLEPAGTGPWLPLQAGQQYTARVRELRRSCDTPLVGDVMVLSVGPQLLATNRAVAAVQVGSILRLSTATEPDLRGVRVAISGGSVLLRDGHRAPLEVPHTLDYRFRSVFERHPRSAVGANGQFIFLVQVDGRQPRLSMGMTLKELAEYMLKLGCKLALNLDGGASSTFWLEGQVLNSPCHGREREIANGLVVVQKSLAQVQSDADRRRRGG